MDRRRKPAVKANARPKRARKSPPSERVLPKALTAPDFPTELPIASRIPEIVELVRAHPVVVIAGETGSGKTTQLPKACLAAGIGRRGMIAHTQPRRLAARTVAARIAEELGVTPGEEVGYAVRFGDQTSARTVVKVMTDGLLLNEVQRDRRLSRYECVIVDEAHERSLNVDFILGCLKVALRRRKDLKVIVTSATIDVDAFADFFGGAPVVEVSGRGYPVETRYLPVLEQPDLALIDCLERIDREAPAGRRDVLVFQSGERDIFDNAQLLKRHFQERFDILPLYARLPPAEQKRVFEPGRVQRVILATNVAETSITVPNIGYVIDPGFARISRYSFRAKLQRLPIETISQASAAQRAGRCGRVAAGVCFRLYAEDDFLARPAYTDPELKRTNLASVVLTMRAFRLGEIEAFPFIDPPDARAVRDAVRLLHELQALRDDRLTEIGHAMARLPVDPRMARILIEAGRTGALAEALIVVSALAAQDPRLRPLDRRAAADQAHARFEKPDAKPDGAKSDVTNAASDFATYVRLWSFLEANRTEMTRSAFRKLLEGRFLSPNRVREWRALHRQLLLACRELGMRANVQPADEATFSRALLTGSLGFIGTKRDVGGGASPRRTGAKGAERAPEYDGPRGMRFRIFPGSALRKVAPKWLVAAEVSDTGATFARCVAAVEPAWIEAAAGHVKKTSHSDPYWDARRGEAMVKERVTVYGLAVAVDRPRRAQEVDPEAAAALFVLEALVRRHRQPVGSRVQAKFLDRNEALIRDIEARQARARRGDLLVSEQVRAKYYADRLPGEICSVSAWQRHVRRMSDADHNALVMSEQDLAAGAAALGRDDFPGRLAIGGHELRLAYKFAPGTKDDGVSLRVDLGVLGLIPGDALDWLVPGFFAEKCEALLRGLPKSLRRQLTPISDRLDTVVERLSGPTYRQGSLYAALSETVRQAFGVTVPVSQWCPDLLPDHLRMNVQVRGARARVLDQDRDIDVLRARLRPAVAVRVASGVANGVERRGLNEFPEDGVPATITLGTSSDRVAGYPVLVDRGQSVDLMVHPTPERQTRLNRDGYARLALLAVPAKARHLARELEHDGDLALHYASVGALGELADRALRRAAWYAFFENRDLPSTRADFDHAIAQGEGLLVPTGQRLQACLREVYGRRSTLLPLIQALESPALALTREDLWRQLSVLAGSGLLESLPSDRLLDLPRYLEGMAMRLNGLQGRVPRDRQGMAAISPWEQRLRALGEAGQDTSDLFFQVQELRILTFAQRLGTRGKVSAKRLEGQFRAVERQAGFVH